MANGTTQSAQTRRFRRSKCRMKPKAVQMQAAWEFLKGSIAAGIVTFLGVLLSVSTVLAYIIPTTCRDGWHSPSIGLRGACSWHGGVYDHGKGAIALLLSAAAAAAVGFWRYSIEEAEADKQRQQDQELQNQKDTALKADAVLQGIACPLCGFPMRKRQARQGRNRGKYFMGCSRHPFCESPKLK